MINGLFRATCLLFLLLPLSAQATWQLATPNRGAITQSGRPIVNSYPHQYDTRIIFDLQRGTLYDNIQRIAKKHGWTLIWYPQQHFPLFTPTHVSGNSYIDAMSRIMAHYPLKVTYTIDRTSQTKVMVVHALHPNN